MYFCFFCQIISKLYFQLEKNLRFQRCQTNTTWKENWNESDKMHLCFCYHWYCNQNCIFIKIMCLIQGSLQIPNVFKLKWNFQNSISIFLISWFSYQIRIFQQKSKKNYADLPHININFCSFCKIVIKWIWCFDPTKANTDVNSRSW